MTAPRTDSLQVRRTTTKRSHATVGMRPEASAVGRKLGIRRGMQLAVVDAPEGFERSLEPLPDESGFPRDSSTPLDLVVLFADTRLDLSTLFPIWSHRLTSDGTIWVAWPRSGANLPTDLSAEIVKRVARGIGLRDDKSCQIDDAWTALRFVR